MLKYPRKVMPFQKGCFSGRVQIIVLVQSVVAFPAVQIKEIKIMSEKNKTALVISAHSAWQ